MHLIFIFIEAPKTNRNNAVEKLPSMYLETDLDTGESKDLSQVQQVLHSYNSLPRGAGYPLKNNDTDSARFETLVAQNVRVLCLRYLFSILQFVRCVTYVFDHILV